MVKKAKDIDEDIINKDKKLNAIFGSYEEEVYDDYLEEEIKEDIFDGIKNLFDGLKKEIDKIEKKSENKEPENNEEKNDKEENM